MQTVHDARVSLVGCIVYECCAGGSWVGSIYIYSGISVATYDNSTVASNIVQQLSFRCWDDNSQQVNYYYNYSPQRYQTAQIIKDLHWFPARGYQWSAIDDQQHHVDGFEGIDISYVALSA